MRILSGLASFDNLVAPRHPNVDAAAEWLLTELEPDLVGPAEPPPKRLKAEAARTETGEERSSDVRGEG